MGRTPGTRAASASPNPAEDDTPSRYVWSRVGDIMHSINSSASRLFEPCTGRCGRQPGGRRRRRQEGQPAAPGSWGPAGDAQCPARAAPRMRGVPLGCVCVPFFLLFYCFNGDRRAEGRTLRCRTERGTRGTGLGTGHRSAAPGGCLTPPTPPVGASTRRCGAARRCSGTGVPWAGWLTRCARSNPGQPARVSPADGGGAATTQRRHPFPVSLRFRLIRRN